jgi:hypothetical protein
MDSAGFGWREVIILGVAAAGIYLAVALLGLARLWRPEKKPAMAEPTAAPEPRPAQAAAVSHYMSWDAPVLTPVQLMADAPPSMNEVERVREEPPPVVASAGAAPFAATLALTELESEVRHLRDDVAALRQELAELKDLRRISPLYADAAALAHRGFDARGVAEECGISVAEAELVMAMSRDEKDFDSEVEDGADGQTRDVAD